MNDKTKTHPLQDESELVKELNCDELCIISTKKEQSKQVKNKKKQLAEGEMYDKVCPPCK